MKINTNVLTTFLKRCAVSTHGIGTKSITSMPDLLLVVDGNQMKVEGLSPAGNLQIHFVETLAEEFEHEKFPIVDTLLFHKIINSEFDNEDVKMIMDGNDIIVTGEESYITFPTINQIETMEKYPIAAEKIRDAGYGKVNFKTCITINALKLSKIIGNMGATYSLYTYDFEVKNNKFTISVKTDDKGRSVKKPKEIKINGIDCNAKYSVGIDSVFKGFIGEVKLQFNQDTPMLAVDEIGNKCIFFPLEN